jgi:phosphatidylglycerol---prolipoprotein diacylglyceryl transferase
MAISIGVGPEFSVGPLTASWHGLAASAGLMVGLAVAVSVARGRRGVDREILLSGVLVMVGAGLVGARLYYALQADRSSFGEPWRLVSETKGFAFYGALMAGLAAFVVFLRRHGAPVRVYLDVVAVGFVPAMALGRVGDLLIGEHLGGRTGLPWGVTYSSADAEVPAVGVAFHSGALYEILMATLLVPVAVAAWRRRGRAGDVFWLVLGLYALGRFIVFFWVTDVPDVALGLSNAQCTSIALAGFAAGGAVMGRRRPKAPSVGG